MHQVHNAAQEKPRLTRDTTLGANSALGIGRATAHQFAENGAKAIYICDYDDSNLAAHQHEIKAAYPHVDVHPWQFDAADEDKVKAVVDDALERYGQLDVFFANAGITGMNTVFTEFTSADFMEVMRINTLRYVECAGCLRRACRQSSTLIKGSKSATTTAVTITSMISIVTIAIKSSLTYHRPVFSWRQSMPRPR